MSLVDKSELLTLAVASNGAPYVALGNAGDYASDGSPLFLLPPAAAIVEPGHTKLLSLSYVYGGSPFLVASFSDTDLSVEGAPLFIAPSTTVGAVVTSYYFNFGVQSSLVKEDTYAWYTNLPVPGTVLGIGSSFVDGEITANWSSTTHASSYEVEIRRL